MSSSTDNASISDHELLIFSWVNFGVVCQIIVIFGIVTNIINIVCFAKQGFKESVNISLLGLAVSDLGSLVTMAWTCVSLTPAVLAADLSFDPVEVMYITSGMAHFSFTRVSSCITAMITIERCLCITAPLKIKGLITPKRVTVITILVFITFFCTSAPVYAVNRLGTKFSSLRNKSLVGLISTKDWERVEMISFAINNFFIPLGAFVIIVVCTTILSYQLRIKAKWRKNTISSTIDERVSSRNQKAAKMIVMISTLFIICFVPVTITVLAIAFVPALSIHGKNLNISIVTGGLGYLLESINSSMNIFIYYHMSIKYRAIFYKLFRAEWTVDKHTLTMTLAASKVTH